MAEFSFTKLPDGSWGVRVWEAPKWTDSLEGVTVKVATKAGAEKPTKLGRQVSSTGRAQTYEIDAPNKEAKPKEEAEAKEDGKPPLPGPDAVPAGRYAYNDGEKWMGVKIWRKGDRVAAYVLTHGGDLDRGEPTNVRHALNSIVAIGVGRAAQEFGWRFGHCGRCGDELKKNLSRKLGMGPVCMKKVFGARDRLHLLADARKELRAAGLDPEAKYDSLETVA
jgi:hypothetical protein